MREKPETIAFWWGRLPHWEVVDGRHFVTIRLAGALPMEGQRRIRELAQQLRVAVYNGQVALEQNWRMFHEMERWLDKAETKTHLSNAQVATMIAEAIDFRVSNGTWTLFDYVIMPNHIHMFFRLGRGSRCLDEAATEGAGSSSQHLRKQRRLKAVLEDFKRWTAAQAGRILSIDGSRFWQSEWFDHWSRSPQEDDKIRDYIRENAVRAGLVKEWRQWPWVWLRNP